MSNAKCFEVHGPNSPANSDLTNSSPGTFSPLMSFSTFSFPTTTLCGAGALRELPGRLKQLSVGRPLVVTDPGLIATEAFKQLEAVLGADGQGRTWCLFQGVHPNPVESDVTLTAEDYWAGGCDGAIAFGGDRAVEAGKAPWCKR